MEAESRRNKAVDAPPRKEAQESLGLKNLLEEITDALRPNGIVLDGAYNLLKHLATTVILTAITTHNDIKIQHSLFGAIAFAE
eukprot:9006227-Pyramimonas_sp.AAC.1